MRYLVTGCAGFIGSSLTDRLLQAGHDVVGIDNFSTGLTQFLVAANKSPRFTLIKADLLDQTAVKDAMLQIDQVFHMAANADVRFGTHHPHKDLEQNTIATFNVLEAMRAHRVKRIAFASTGSIYGEAPLIPTPENAPFPIQTSLYGASKLAAEGLIQAYCEGFDFQAYIFRFVSILGERYTHGHVFDFYKQLLANPDELYILGNGKQRKSYLYIQDCIDAILWAMEHAQEKVNLFNLGTDEYCQVNDSIGWICDYLKLTPKKTYAGGERGWIGDNPFIFLDCAKVRELGWKPKLTIREGVMKTIEYLHQNPWVLEERDEKEGGGQGEVAIPEFSNA
ncbi:MAG TPA: NAD-dependent epimerase/dehydratase family protein [Gammaproteobacteria bacterium]|jgi:UDP-glucose 4-epimerase|nr:NAD-dependent epimerase/dehydratase family protein [Gammaproteobacteria bacterium]